MDHQVRVFRDGDIQSVEVPREYAFAGDTATMRQDGTQLIIDTKPKRSLLEVLESLEPLGPDDCWQPIEQLEHRELNL